MKMGLERRESNREEVLEMKGTKKVLRGTGKVILALLTGVFMPILVWVALGVAIKQEVRQRKSKQAPVPTIGEILATAGLTIQDETTTGKLVAARTFTQRPAAEIRQVLVRAGLAIHDEPNPKYHPEPRVLELEHTVKQAF